MQGWIKLHRCLMSKPIWTDSTPEQKTILITLLMMANHQGKEWEFQGQRYTAEPGQFVTSLESIALKCGKGITIQNVRTALKRFEKYEFLTNESTNKNRLVTIVNWGIYQSSDDEPNKQANSQLASNQQATNKQLTTNKNVKNVKNVKNDKNEKNEKNEKKKPSSPKQVYDEQSIHFKLALRLYQNILNNNPDHKEPNLQKWANDVRLMIDQDKRTEEQISYLMDWVQKDSFWKSNILSTSKLREKFDQLVIRVKEDISKQNRSVKNEMPRAYQSLQDWADEE